MPCWVSASARTALPTFVANVAALVVFGVLHTNTGECVGGAAVGMVVALGHVVGAGAGVQVANPLVLLQLHVTLLER